MEPHRVQHDRYDIENGGSAEDDSEDDINDDHEAQEFNQVWGDPLSRPQRLESTTSTLEAETRTMGQDDATVSVGANDDVMSRMELNTNKAGMAGVDKRMVDKVIRETSKGSRFWLNEEKNAKKTEQKIADMKVQLEKHRKSGALRSTVALQAIDSKIKSMEKQRDLSRTIVHVDMDMFYAAVEERDNPALRGVPMAVGGIGMLSTSNYEARKFGVRAAMPGYIALKLCPHLIIVPGRYAAYREAAAKVREVLKTFDPCFDAIGLDEAFVDFTDYINRNLNGNSEACEESSSSPKLDRNDTRRSKLVKSSVAKMRSMIQEATGLTASAGIAANKRLAKICSDINKPDGQYYLEPTVPAILSFVRSLSVRKINGIGKVTQRMLAAIGINTVREMFEQRLMLSLLFSEISFSFFLRVSLGLGSSSMTQHSRKSISHERTFGMICNPDELIAKCESLCDALGRDVGERNLVGGHTVTLKLKTVNFEVLSRATTVSYVVSTASQLRQLALPLLEAEIKASGNRLSLRLMGIRLSALKEVSTEVTLKNFIEKKRKRKQDDFARDSLPNKVSCPVCGMTLESVKLNDHMDACLLKSSEEATAGSAAKSALNNEAKTELKDTKAPCPICGSHIYYLDMSDHVDECLSKQEIREILKGPSTVTGSKRRNTDEKAQRTLQHYTR